MIRRATREDIPEVMAICRAQVGRPNCVWTSEYPCEDNFVYDYEHDNLFVFYECESSESGVLANSSDSEDINQQIAGCLSIESPNDLADMTEVEVHGPLAIEISRVAIRPELQGRSLASRMISEFIALMRSEGIRAIQLLVAKANPAAIRTYVNNGFVIKGDCYMFENDYYIGELILDDVEIRRAVPTDLNSIMQLYEHLHNNKIPDDMTRARTVWEQIMNDPNHHIILASVNGQIVSSVVCLIVPNLTHDQRPYALIENVVTNSSYRGRGLATKCLDYAYTVALSRNCYKLMLLTGAKDDKTLNFYRNAGYNCNDKTAFIRWIK